MAAKRLARTAGLDYAIMSGGDVAPLGALRHQLFNFCMTDISCPDLVLRDKMKR